MIANATQQSIEIPHDSVMTGIEEAAQPLRMLSICRDELKSVPEKERARWSQCVVTDAVYQPGRACRIAFALSAEESVRPTLVYARWPAGRRTHASAARINSMGTPFELYLYPRDRRMRHIRAMRRSKWLHAASQEWFGRRYGRGRFVPDSWRCSPIKYVPESRLVCRLKGEWQTAEGAQWRRGYVRISRRNNARRHYAFLNTLIRSLDQARCELTPPSPLGVIPERSLLATEFVRGRVLREALASRDAEELIHGSRTIARLGGMCVSESALPAGPQDAISPHEMLGELAVALPFIDVHARTLSAWADTIPEVPVNPGLVHGDLHTGQMIRKNDRLIVVDWDIAHRGDPTQDITNLAAEIEAAQLFGDGEQSAEDLPTAVVEGWRDAGGALNRPAARWWATRAFVLRAWGLLRHLRSGWQDHGEALLDRAAHIYAHGCTWTE